MEDNPEQLEVIYVTEMTDAAVHWDKVVTKLRMGIPAVVYSKGLLPIDEFATLPQVACSLTITGWGGTWLEPNVPPPDKMISWLHYAYGKLGDRVRLRIDPIVPSQEGFNKACSIAKQILVPIRTIVSILQFYKGMEETFRKLDIKSSIYTDKSGRAWFPKREVAAEAYRRLKYANPNLTYQFCGMPYEVGDTHTGCVDDDLLAAIGVTNFKRIKPGVQRPGCKCVIQKRQLVSGPCKHACQYCYARHGSKAEGNTP